MTTVLAQKGQIVIPKSIREELDLQPGDDFEIYVQDGEIICRPLSKARNRGLMNILLNPPGQLKIPDREKSIPGEGLDLS